MLAVSNIEVRYGAIPALHDVSCVVRKGEVVNILGANGAGKSTFLKAVIGLLHPTRGTITFEGHDISRLPPAEIIPRGITYIPEDRRIFAPLSVEENLRLGAFIVRDKASIPDRLAEVYRLFPRLKERRKQQAGTMSGGEQQMLAIGRGLMSRPKLLMLDEPSVGLMPKLVTEVMEAVKTLRDEGYTILLVEQKVQESLEVADQAYVLQTGRTVAHGPAAEMARSDLVRTAYLAL
jgi:branched-chain amino acid transport system ATP-binding protein